MIWRGWAARLERVKGAITNWSFFLVVYTIIGLNKSFLLEQPLSLLPLAAVALATTFGLGAVIEHAGRLMAVDRDRLASLVLLGTLKNTGLAGGLALALFDRRTSLPAVVSTLFMIVYLIWLSSRKRWHDRAVRSGRP
jgi:BASS family bile acid:Na+ symporter